MLSIGVVLRHQSHQKLTLCTLSAWGVAAPTAVDSERLLQSTMGWHTLHLRQASIYVTEQAMRTS